MTIFRITVLTYVLTVIRKVKQNAENGELQQTSSTNPWKDIERTVRTVDEERVKDCTEDIDTLLVFVCVAPVYFDWL